MIKGKVETDGPVGPYASNGEPYITFSYVTPMPKPEGDAFEYINKVEEARATTLNRLFKQLQEYCDGGPGHVEWRIRPHTEVWPAVDPEDPDDHGLMRSRCRMKLVPPKEDDDDQ